MNFKKLSALITAFFGLGIISVSAGSSTIPVNINVTYPVAYTSGSNSYAAGELVNKPLSSAGVKFRFTLTGPGISGGNCVEEVTLPVTNGLLNYSLGNKYLTTGVGCDVAALNFNTNYTVSVQGDLTEPNNGAYNDSHDFTTTTTYKSYASDSALNSFLDSKTLAIQDAIYSKTLSLSGATGGGNSSSSSAISNDGIVDSAKTGLVWNTSMTTLNNELVAQGKQNFKFDLNNDTYDDVLVRAVVGQQGQLLANAPYTVDMYGITLNVFNTSNGNFEYIGNIPYDTFTNLIFVKGEYNFIYNPTENKRIYIDKVTKTVKTDTGITNSSFTPGTRITIDGIVYTYDGVNYVGGLSNTRSVGTTSSVTTLYPTVNINGANGDDFVNFNTDKREFVASVEGTTTTVSNVDVVEYTDINHDGRLDLVTYRNFGKKKMYKVFLLASDNTFTQILGGTDGIEGESINVSSPLTNNKKFIVVNREFRTLNDIIIKNGRIHSIYQINQTENGTTLLTTLEGDNLSAYGYKGSGVELFRNGGFEMGSGLRNVNGKINTGFDSIRRNGSGSAYVSYATDQKKFGGQSLKLWAGPGDFVEGTNLTTGSYYQYVEGDSVNLKPRTKYKFSAWYKTNVIVPGDNVNGFSIQVLVRQHSGGNGDKGYKCAENIQTTNDWTYCSIEFDTESVDGAYANTYFTVYNHQGNRLRNMEAWVDGVSLMEVTNDQPNTLWDGANDIMSQPTNLIPFGDFDNMWGSVGASGLIDGDNGISPRAQIIGGGAVQTDNRTDWAKNGNSLQIVQVKGGYIEVMNDLNGGWYWSHAPKSIQLKPNTTYTYSADYRTLVSSAGTDSGFNIGILVRDLEGGANRELQCVSGVKTTTGNYQNCSINFTTGSKAEANILISVYGHNGNKQLAMEAWVDNLSLKEVTTTQKYLWDNDFNNVASTPNNVTPRMNNIVVISDNLGTIADKGISYFKYKFFVFQNGSFYQLKSHQSNGSAGTTFEPIGSKLSPVIGNNNSFSAFYIDQGNSINSSLRRTDMYYIFGSQIIPIMTGIQGVGSESYKRYGLLGVEVTDTTGGILQLAKLTYDNVARGQFDRWNNFNYQVQSDGQVSKLSNASGINASDTFTTSGYNLFRYDVGYFYRNNGYEKLKVYEALSKIRFGVGKAAHRNQGGNGSFGTNIGWTAIPQDEKSIGSYISQSGFQSQLFNIILPGNELYLDGVTQQGALFGIGILSPVNTVQPLIDYGTNITNHTVNNLRLYAGTGFTQVTGFMRNDTTAGKTVFWDGSGLNFLQTSNLKTSDTDTTGFAIPYYNTTANYGSRTGVNGTVVFGDSRWNSDTRSLYRLSTISNPNTNGVSGFINGSIGEGIDTIGGFWTQNPAPTNTDYGNWFGNNIARKPWTNLTSVNHSILKYYSSMWSPGHPLYSESWIYKDKGISDSYTKQFYCYESGAPSISIAGTNGQTWMTYAKINNADITLGNSWSRANLINSGGGYNLGGYTLRANNRTCSYTDGSQNLTAAFQPNGDIGYPYQMTMDSGTQFLVDSYKFFPLY